MDSDLAIIVHWWGYLGELERGTVSWVAEALAARSQGLPTLPCDVSLESVLAFLGDQAEAGWHCDCCRWRRDAR